MDDKKIEEKIDVGMLELQGRIDALLGLKTTLIVKGCNSECRFVSSNGTTICSINCFYSSESKEWLFGGTASFNSEVWCKLSDLNHVD
jgi:hypothetical protein